MAKIVKIKGRQILDSRGNPTVECILETTKGFVRASVPSGASTGIHEALELRDNGEEYCGKGVLKAVENVQKIGRKIKGMEVNQEKIDAIIKDMAGENKKDLGANATLAVSMCITRAEAQEKGVELYEHISKKTKNPKIIPIPHFNIINGGKHAGGKLAIQEFMIAPVKAKDFTEAYKIGMETYHKLKNIIEHKYGRVSINVGDEGGFAPNMKTSEEAFMTIQQALMSSGHKAKTKIAIDAAATSFYDDGKYYIDGKHLTTDGLIEKYNDFVKEFGVYSIEDPFQEEDFKGFAEALSELKIQIVADDLTVTNIQRLRKAIEEKSANCLLLKINQIGTITEALQAYEMAKKQNGK